MLIEVQDSTGCTFLARQSVLPTLIASKAIRRLRRSSGWVEFPGDQRCANDTRYHGPRRRLSDLATPDKECLDIRAQLAVWSLDKILGDSPNILSIIHQIELVAPTNLAVLIQGETGTGKGVLARILRELSERKNKPFITVDCGAIPESLIESELFGHARGSFTGAYQQKVGKFEAANGGTIFLDEVGNLSRDLQTKLLQCLEEKVIYQVGGVKPIRLDIRVISATNAHLLDEVRKSNFREDLYYRLNEFEIWLPPLRERSSDIFFYLDKFLSEASSELAKNIIGLSPETGALLRTYPWPGNIREMRNVVKRATLLANGNVISLKDLPVSLLEYDTSPVLHGFMESALTGGYPGRQIMQRVNESAEKDIIKRALDVCGNNKTKAAKLLGLNYSTLYRKLKKYGSSWQ